MRAAVLSVVLAGASAGAALGQIQPPTTRAMDCTTGGCHAKQIDHEYLHGPTALKACDACHEYASPEKHSFQMKRPGRELCDFCHIDKRGTEGAFVHDPVAKGDCRACHDPHGASNPRMLKKVPVSALCVECHKETLNGKHVHSPAAGDCTACHKAHTSDHQRLLIAEPRALCLGCHGDVGKAVDAAAYPHKPATGECVLCHTPHSSNEIKALRASPQELCGSCHEGVSQIAMNATQPHSAVLKGRACLNCHTAHGSDHTKQLFQSPIGACLECHKVPIKVSEERTVAAVPELGVDTLYRHGPAAKSECAACHDVHGGSELNLLTKPYSRDFYQGFSEEAYALCLSCHDKNIFLGQSAEAMTQFRNGTQNLHTVHVPVGAQGRNCRACHTMHASRFEAQICETVPFGQWKLPINFAPSSTGGSCAPGCHKPAAYDRVTPVIRATKAAPPLPATAPPTPPSP